MQPAVSDTSRWYVGVASLLIASPAKDAQVLTSILDPIGALAPGLGMRWLARRNP